MLSTNTSTQTCPHSTHQHVRHQHVRKRPCWSAEPIASVCMGEAHQYWITIPQHTRTQTQTANGGGN